MLELTALRRRRRVAGLKATEGDLEKLKCEKCDFQAYYDYQYQQHIAASHVADVHKCKCCQFATFNCEHLFVHFKVGRFVLRFLFLIFS